MAEIRITPGGFITNKPRHAIGMRGSSPFITNPTTIEGFRNLVSWYGEIAYPMLNSAADTKVTAGGLSAVTVWLGRYTFGATDLVDMALQNVYMSIVQGQRTSAVLSTFFNCNGEFAYPPAAATAATWTVASQNFTTAGTVTLTAGSSAAVGAGTTWTTNVLAQAGHPALPNILPGDVLMVEDGLSNWTAFRIAAIANDTHLGIVPTPTTGNPALGSGLTYKIIRTGYNSNSSVQVIPVQSGNTTAYFYYAGMRGFCNGATTASQSLPTDYGTICCVSDAGSGGVHIMAPRTVDTSGTTTGADPVAVDVIFYKGFLLYGAGPAISWSIAGFPSALPFGATDFPAANIDVVAPNDTFVAFEPIGDQVVAIFQKSQWLVTPTGSIPQFAFYRMPEAIGCLDPVAADQLVANIFNHARPCDIGRGSFFFLSNRGVEVSGGALADEVSATVSTALHDMFGNVPLTVSWDDSQDGLIVRKGLGSDVQVSLFFNAKTRDWSTLLYVTESGSRMAGLTGSIDGFPQNQEYARDIHRAYYEVVNGAVPGTNGGSIRHVTASLDENVPTQGFSTWSWPTPVLPMGLNYPDFSTGGFVFDAYSLNSLPVMVDWVMYYGSSPYNLLVWDSGTMSFAGAFPSPWISSRQRLSKKSDAPFIMFKFSSSFWVAPVAVILFDAQTQAMR